MARMKVRRKQIMGSNSRKLSVRTDYNNVDELTGSRSTGKRSRLGVVLASTILGLTLFTIPAQAKKGEDIPEPTISTEVNIEGRRQIEKITSLSDVLDLVESNPRKFKSKWKSTTASVRRKIIDEMSNYEHPAGSSRFNPDPIDSRYQRLRTKIFENINRRSLKYLVRKVIARGAEMYRYFDLLYNLRSVSVPILSKMHADTLIYHIRSKSYMSGNLQSARKILKLVRRAFIDMIKIDMRRNMGLVARLPTNYGGILSSHVVSKFVSDNGFKAIRWLLKFAENYKPEGSMIGVPENTSPLGAVDKYTLDVVKHTGKLIELAQRNPIDYRRGITDARKDVDLTIKAYRLAGGHAPTALTDLKGELDKMIRVDSVSY